MTSGRHGLPGRRWGRIGLVALAFGVFLAIGVSVMAQSTGSERNGAAGVVPTSTGSPSFPAFPSSDSNAPGVATNSPAPKHAPRPVGTPALPVAVIVTEGSQPSIAPVQGTTPVIRPVPHRSTPTSHPAPTPRSSSAPPPPPPSSSSAPPPPPPSSSQPPPPAPTPTPKKCLVPNPLQPGTCLIPMP
jgi:hypothetical protein